MPSLVPFTMVAKTFTVPSAVVFNWLPPVMVALVVPASDTVHTIVWLVAVVGATVPTSVNGVPAKAVVATPVMPVTDTMVDVTVISNS